MTDFRVASYLEARECLGLVRNQKPDQPEFWANLLGAIANATIATMPDEVYEGIMAELARQEHLRRLSQKNAQSKINKDLQRDDGKGPYPGGRYTPQYYDDPDFLRGDPQQRK